MGVVFVLLLLFIAAVLAFVWMVAIVLGPSMLFWIIAGGCFMVVWIVMAVAIRE